jgi:hypothetical protein
VGQVYASSHSVAENSSDSIYAEDDVPINLLDLSLLTSRTYNIARNEHDSVSYLACHRSAKLELEAIVRKGPHLS